MNILLVASEAVPFAKTGGLADVAGALPKYLRQLGIDVALMMPLYQKIHAGNFKLTRERASVRVPIGQSVYEGAIWSSILPDTDIPVYFIQQDTFFNRAELYREHGQDYKDNSQRFIFFSRGCLEAIKVLGLRPDLIHANDWQTGLMPVYIKTLYRNDPEIGRIASLFTVHNLAYQGLFWHWDMPLTGLPWDLFNWTELEFYGKLNFLKGGLVFADCLSTVSKTYAKEIQGEEMGCGLEGVLTHRKNELFGVVNGIDYSVWNPESDEFLAAKYSAEDLSGKAKCKKALQKENNLPQKANVPLVGMISRLDDQKGFDILTAVMEEVMGLGIQLVLLGTGDPKHHETFKKVSETYPGQAGINLTFDNAMAHRIEAGADIFLMPSRYEPCGLNQIYSLKYGTVPVVRATGGLADTIVDYDNPQTGSSGPTGFAFQEYRPEALLKGLQRAVGVFKKPKDWKTLVTNCMKQDWSWARAAAEYVDLYHWTLGRKQKAMTGQGGAQALWQKTSAK